MNKIYKYILMGLVTGQCLFPVVSPLNAAQMTFKMNGFNGGLFNKFSPDNIQDNEVSEIMNLYLDKEIGIIKRKGYTKYNNTALSNYPVKNLYNFNNGIDYLVAVTSSTIFQSQNGVFTSIKSNTSQEDWSFISWLNVLIGINRVDSSFTWDGVTYSQNNNIPNGDMCILYGDRLWITGVSGNRSVLYYSALFDYNSFDSVNDYEYVGKDDGDVITALQVYNGNLYIYKRNSIWAFIGVDPTSTSGMQKTIVNKEVGCVDKNSIQAFQGYLIFLSKRGLEKFDGYKVEKISEKVEKTINNIRQVNGQKNYWINTLGEDWNSGTIMGFDTTTIDGSMITNVSTGTMEYGVGGSNAWGRHCHLKLDSNLNPCISYFDWGNNDLMFSSFTPGVGWNYIAVDANASGQGNALALDIYNNPHILYCGAANTIKYSSYTPNIGWSNPTTIATNSGFVVETPIDIDIDTNNVIHILYTNVTLSNLIYSSYTYATQSWSTSTIYSSGLVYIAKLKNYENTLNVCLSIPNYVLFTSATIGGTWSTPATVKTLSDDFYGINLCMDKNGTPNICFVLSSIDGLYYSSYTLSTNMWSYELVDNSLPNIDSSEFVGMAISTITHSTYMSYKHSDTHIYITSAPIASTMVWSKRAIDTAKVVGQYSSLALDGDYINVAFENTTNNKLAFFSYQKRDTWISPVKNTGSNNSLWDLFNSVYLSSNNVIKFYVKTATDSAIIDNALWIEVTNGNIINSLILPYIKLKIESFRYPNNQSPEIKSTVTNWFNGSAFTSVASAIYDNRYYLAFSTGCSQNTMILVLDDKWNYTLLDIPVSSMIIFNNKLYTGTSQNTGYIYQQDVPNVYTDDGNAIDSTLVSKAYDMGDSVQEKVFDNMYAIFQSTNSNFTMSYYIDESTTSYGNWNVGMSSRTRSGIGIEKMPFRVSDQKRGRYIKFKVNHNDLNKYFHFKGIQCTYESIDSQQR